MTIPPLNLDIHELILAHAMCTHLPMAARYSGTIGDAAACAAISTLLNVLPPAATPELFQVLLKRMPWIDTNTACQLGNLALLNYLHKRLRGKRPIQFTYPRALVLAASGGHLQVFDWWAHNIGVIALTDKARVAVVEAASQGGHVDIVARYAPSRLDKECQVQEYTSSVRAASAGGHLPLLHLWHSLGYVHSEILDGSVLAVAMVAGHLDVVQWWLDKHMVLIEVPKVEVRTALSVAAMTGNRIGLDLMLRQTNDELFDSQIAGFSCATGDLDWIRFCQAKAGGQLSADTAVAVSLALGHIHVLEWLLTFNSSTDLGNTLCASEWIVLEHAVCALVSHQSCLHDQVLGWQPFQRLIENGRGAGRVSPYTAACIGGNVDSLIWLHGHGIAIKQVLDLRLVDIATGYGHVQALEWIRIHLPHKISSVSPATLTKYMQWATNEGQVCVLDWWKEQSGHTFTVPDEGAVRIQFFQALRLGHVQVLEWWQHKRPYPVMYRSSDVIRAIISGLQSDLGVRWWMQHGKNMNVHQVFRALSAQCHMALVDELIARCHVPDESIMCCALNSFPRALDWLEWVLKPSNTGIVKSTAAAFRVNNCFMVCNNNAMFLDACWQAGWIQEPFYLDVPSRGELSDQDDSRIAVWEWAMSTGMLLRCKPDSLYEISQSGKIHLLEWFTARLTRFAALVVPTSILDLNRRCNPSGFTPLSACVIRWWKGYGLPDVEPVE